MTGPGGIMIPTGTFFFSDPNFFSVDQGNLANDVVLQNKKKNRVIIETKMSFED